MPHVDGTCLGQVLLDAPWLGNVESADNISDRYLCLQRCSPGVLNSCLGLTGKDRGVPDENTKKGKQHKKGPHCSI
jgi:hypothetical protein